MVDWISKILDIAKLPAKFVAAIWIGSGFVLLSPQLWLGKLEIAQLRADYGSYFGLAFIFSSAYLLAMVLDWTVRKLHEANRRRQRKKTVREDMQSLNDNEIAVLREFLLQEQNTLQMPINEPVVAGLLSRGIIEQVSPLGHSSVIGIEMPVRISPIVRDIVTPQFVGWSGGLPTKEQLEENLENRPDFFKTH